MGRGNEKEIDLSPYLRKTTVRKRKRDGLHRGEIRDRVSGEISGTP